MARLIIRYCFLIAIISFILPTPCFAISLDTNESIILNDKQYYFEDTSRVVSIRDIIKGNSAITFRPNTHFAPSYSRSSFWGKVPLINHSDTLQDLVITLTSYTFNHVEFFHVKNNKILSGTKMGIDYPFQIRQLNNRNYAFNFKLPARDPWIVYWNPRQKGGTLNTQYLLMDKKNFSQTNSRHNMIFSLFFGMQLCLCFLSLIFFIIFRNRIYIFYSLYIFFLFLHFFSLLGYSHQFLWQNLPKLNSASQAFWLILSIIFSIFLCIEILSIRREKKRTILYFFYGLVALYLLFSISTFLDVHPTIQKLIINVYYCSILFTFFMCIYAPIKTIETNKKISLVYLSAFIPIIIITTVIILFNYNLFPTSPYLFEFINMNFHYLIIGAATLEAVFLSVAMGYKFKMTEKERIWLMSRLKTLEEQSQKPLSKKPESIPLHDENMLVEINEKLIDIITTQKVFLDEKITLNLLAEQLQTTPHLLSKTINHIQKMHFFDFINLYRIAEAKKILADPNKTHFTIEGIGFEVGFNNKTSFNKAFKKFTEQTPSEFRRQTL